MFKIQFVALTILAAATTFAANFASDPAIVFERNEMTPKADSPGWRVEGYWQNRNADQSPYPFPIAHKESWPGKESFLAKLAKMEGVFKEAGRVVQYFGYAYSRLEPGTRVGACEFSDPLSKIVWPCGFAEHYIGKYNVVPSREFYNYVMAFDLNVE